MGFIGEAESVIDGGEMGDLPNADAFSGEAGGVTRRDEATAAGVWRGLLEVMGVRVFVVDWIGLAGVMLIAGVCVVVVVVVAAAAAAALVASS